MASVKLNMEQVKFLMSGPGGPVVQDLNRRSNRVLNAARRLCPVDEGKLKNSITREFRQEGAVVIARVGTNVSYALWVHEGTGIYAGKGPIRPVRARALRWPVKNNTGQGRRRYRGGATAQYAFAKSVKGSPGRPFLRNALDAAK